MNREIKFRLWYYDQEKFDYNVGFKDFKKYSFPLYWCCVQQYTGLKDKNGVEIFEGDIVKAYSEEFENENFTGKVIFDEGSFLTWINKNDIRGVWCGDNIEVAGNVFENPELLNI